MKTLKSVRLPTLIFINKIDRRGARTDALLADIRRLLTADIVPMGTVSEPGTAEARFSGYAHREAQSAWAPILAEHDDALLADLVDDVTPTFEQVGAAVRRQTGAGAVVPVLFGSALTGAGVADLVNAIGTVLPPAPSAEPQLRARVFAIERRAGQKVAYVRSYGGDLQRRARVPVFRRDPDGHISSYRGQITGLRVIGDPDATGLESGYIAAIQGLPGIRIGDQVGTDAHLDVPAYFAKPSLETVVSPADGVHTEALHAALMNLADEDPLIQTRVTAAGQTGVLLYGEVQKEVIGTTLADVYGIPAEFSRSEIVHNEHVTGTGSRLHWMAEGFGITIGFRVSPGLGVNYVIESEFGTLIPSFHAAVEETVRRSLEQGRYGWPITDVTVTMTRSRYGPGVSPSDFRLLVPMVLMAAVAEAGTRVYEPCHRFEADVPAERLGVVTGFLAHLGARIDGTDESAGGWAVTGEIPTRLVHEAQHRLPGLTNGEGAWSSVPGGDRAVVGRPPVRPRTDGNPFSKTEYMRFLAQRDLAIAGH
jgi:ribosomal protection tetracycline resistance protein